ncbi:MAG: hypothetical protein CBC48_18155 [bacterium TMED88]|nr:hypothetical protein [Deltaproteobacteria bacterium]MDG2049017.1 sulfatase [Myxococcota bacterium]OUV23937.1 MAG: hypothetical protein CBC48_18155 [bacterium TMED88]
MKTLFFFRRKRFSVARSLLVLGIAAWVACDSAPPSLPEGESSPLIVFIIIDTLRADHVGAYGAAEDLTPNIDALAREGVVFENAIASSSWTRSSIASMITSRYPTKLGVLGRSDAIPASAVTLAEVLKERGFTTQGIVTNSNAGKSFGFDQGFDRFIFPEKTQGHSEDAQTFVAEGVTETALELLDATPRGEPTFLYLHYQDPHDPYLPHPGFSDAKGPEGRFNGSRNDLNALDNTPLSEISQSDLDHIRNLYSGEVAYCDYWIGELIRGLESRGLLKDTMIIITSDHGEGLWDHGVRDHGRDLYEEMIRVPLIVWTSSEENRGDRLPEPVSHLDLAPTILGALGIPIPAAFEGVDLSSAISGQPQQERAVYSELSLDGADLKAARHSGLKLIRGKPFAKPSRTVELYDLKKDPGETENFAAVARDDATHLEADLSHWEKLQEKDRARAEYVNLSALDEDSIQNLQVLGYLETPDSQSSELWPVVDFARDSGPEAQFIEGFYRHHRNRRWIAERARLLLGRRGEEGTWRLRGWIDLDFHGVEKLTLSVSVNGEKPVKREIRDTGFFILEGGLPADDSDVIDLRIECDHSFRPEEDRELEEQRNLCVVVQKVGLY